MTDQLNRMGVRATMVLVLLLATPARADPVTLNGITFSDELGGFVIVAGSGSGTPDDPFVVVERITGDGPAVLVIRGLTLAFGNPVRSNHFAGFALTKVVINATGRVWGGFGLGLEQRLGQTSTYYDGLSFGQDDTNRHRRIDSDHYQDSTIVDEPADGVLFHDGAVRPGERVVFRMTITDNSPVPEFFLVQRGQEPIVMAPKPSPQRG